MQGCDEHQRRVVATDIGNLPGGEKLSKRLTKIHPAQRDVRRVLKEVERVAADEDHVLELINSLASSEAFLPKTTRTKLNNLLDADCVLEVIAPLGVSLFKKLLCCI